MNYRRFDSSEGNVWKYVFTKDDMVAEAVLYKYENFLKRTVICCSTMSGCPVGCEFCGTGKKFIRNLSTEEIVQQIEIILRNQNLNHIINNAERFQIMFMSMGEPLLNYDAVDSAIRLLHNNFPQAELLISTIGPMSPALQTHYNQLCKTSEEISKVGLQFSIHKSTDKERNKLIPYKNKLSLKEIRDMGIIWNKYTNRPVYLNYCIDGTNNTKEDAERLKTLFSPVIFNLTFSVVCSKDETMKDAGYKNLDAIREFEQSFLADGYNTRIFDPAGQDDIGGGCGQLWYVQQWIKEHNK